jgi:HSP20 family protein
MVYPLARFDWTLDPFRELQRLQREMNRLFAGFSAAVEEFPALNLWSSPDEAVLIAEIPGVDPKDVDVSVAGNVVTVEGERKEDGSIPSENYHRRERETGKFMRSVRLPYEVEADKVQARYEHGVLRVTLPRKETSKPRRIAIQSDA